MSGYLERTTACLKNVGAQIEHCCSAAKDQCSSTLTNVNEFIEAHRTALFASSTALLAYLSFGVTLIGSAAGYYAQKFIAKNPQTPNQDADQQKEVSKPAKNEEPIIDKKKALLVTAGAAFALVSIPVASIVAILAATYTIGSSAYQIQASYFN